MSETIFDIISFITGIVAGGVTGALAAILYGLERTADLQQNLLRLSKELAAIDPKATAGIRPNDADSEKRLQELRAELDSIRDEIRTMYRKTST